MSDEPTDGARAASAGEEDRERNRRLLLWLWLLLAIVILIVLFAVCAGGEDDVALPASPATTTTVAVPVSTPAPTEAPQSSATPEPAPEVTAAPQATTTSSAPAPTTTEVPLLDISGIWTFFVDVTETGGACAGEQNEPVAAEPVTIVQDGDVLTVTGLNGNDPPWQGRIEENLVTFSGERNEDDGRTVASFVLTVSDDGKQLSGIEEWTWSGPGGSCNDSLSEVSAGRQ